MVISTKKKNISKKESEKPKVSLEEYQILKEDFLDLKEYLEELRETLPIGFCALGARGIVNDTNKSFQELTGYKLLEIIACSIDSFFSPKEAVAELLKEAQKRGSAKGKEMILIAKDKKEIPVTVSVSLREDPNGNFIGFFITVADITEEKKFQRELQKKITELERFQKLTVGRELKMVELKKEITILKTELKQTKGRL